jgi:sugar-specific transcriptional regulator TrmB
VPSPNEEIQALTKLGLTVLQAKVYLTLAKSGKTTIKIISQASKIDRSDVYRIVSKLQEKGLVEKIITTPNTFKAVPIHDGLPMLLRRKAEEYNEIEAKAKELLQKYEKNNEEKPLQEDVCQFILVPKKEASRRKFTNAIENTQTSCDMILHWECFRYGMTEDTETWKKAVEKGVKIRFIVYKSEDEKAVSRIVQILKKKGSFKVRYIFTPPPTTISIFDKKETIITISPTPHPRETPNLWSNNPSLIAIFQDYFELMWRASKKSKHKKTNYNLNDPYENLNF